MRKWGGGVSLKRYMTLYKRPKGDGQLTEDFERSGGLPDAGRSSIGLAEEAELIRRLDRGDGQSEVLSDSGPASQRGAVIGFSVIALGAESNALPGFLLLLDGLMNRKRVKKDQDRKISNRQLCLKIEHFKVQSLYNVFLITCIDKLCMAKMFFPSKNV